jgi:hypothetical protein
MKTHELAKALTRLARWLRAGPNIELANLELLGSRSKRAAPADAVALSSLVAFSRFSKQEWAELIKEYRLPIEVKNTYSARDVMGKIMGYFAENPDARQQLMERVERQPSKASPELMRALSTLLKS